ncbi:hypothetical protein HLB44_36445 [Aquincola sp. S2]|uniref:DUF1795 domain-containing protein n=1 Tax=Pseudaquabacterium terrae TaxID=2732868 RepID=A0ABX2EUP6_9BURK|nr:hypothetical protein [Aquabacterium terrae]NRF72454.1 hypothetical protein [Aquabacterium terrae]
MKHHRAAALALLAWNATCPSTASAENLEFRGLSIEWLDGFTRESFISNDMFAFKDRAGTRLVVQVFPSTLVPGSLEATRLIEARRTFVEDQLPKLQRVCDITNPTARAISSSGLELYSNACKRRNPGGAEFVLQYFLVSPAGGLALFTVYGNGTAGMEYKKYTVLFESAKW